MRQINIYLYPELDKKAKEKARQWGIDMELQDPAWLTEHKLSQNHAIDEIKTIDWDDENKIKDLIERSDKAEFTGYCADCILANILKNSNVKYTVEDITRIYNNAWEEELEERISNITEIEEAIISNGYEFLPDGGIY